MDSTSVGEGRRVPFRRRRVGVDLDRVSRLTLLRVYFNSHYFFPDVKIDVKETGKGHHFRIHKENTVKQDLDVRRNLLDDSTRLKFDELRLTQPELHSWIDTLFSSKWRNGKIVSVEEDCNVLSEAFWSKLPARKV